ncbi:MAG TPA: 2-hydroxy-acid oxidase, partial [Firmicutes bacterium]|nr:2-hydroxy-acid oxidase [Bacillota bacterium]
MPYKKITTDDLEFLKKITAPDRIYTGREINDDFTHDEMTEYGKFSPEVVVEAL